MVIAYDFDGTLADGNMQESKFLPDIKMKPEEFWTEVKKITKREQADEVLIYMNLMLKKANEAGVSVHLDDFKRHGESVKLFRGVEDWFDRIKEYGRQKSVRVEHALVSSGNAEIFAGTSIASKFSYTYASKFMFDHNGVAVWPALAINYTTKTQYLFRINKGAHDLSDSSKVNQLIEPHDRPVQFENMVFIGDGHNDIPCFSLIKEKGGLSVAVYKPHGRKAHNKAEQYIKDGRVHCSAPADYSEGGKLDRIIKANIDAVSARARLNHEKKR